MHALLVTSPGVAEVAEIDDPVASDGLVVVDVSRAGVCGTDLALFGGDPARLAHTRSSFPLRLGHEWCGVVSEIGAGVDPGWLGRRVTSDTMIGCGVCERCRGGLAHLCADRYEIGVRGGWPGALAQRLPVPARVLHALPDAIGDDAGAMIEPGANAWRAVEAAGVRAGSRVLVLGAGTIGLLAASLAVARGAEVHVLGRGEPGLELARRMGLIATTLDELPDGDWESVVDASDSDLLPRLATERVRPGGRIALVGVSTDPSLLDSRTLVRGEVTVFGIMGGSAGIEPTIEAYASGAVDPTPQIRGVLDLPGLAAWFNGGHPALADLGTKVLVDPTRPAIPHHENSKD